MHVVARVGEGLHQTVRRVRVPVSASGRIRDAGQVTVGIQSQGGALPERRDNRRWITIGIALDPGHISIGVRDRTQSATRVITEGVNYGAGERVERIEMFACRVEQVNLAGILGSNGDTRRR